MLSFMIRPAIGETGKYPGGDLSFFSLVVLYRPSVGR